MKPRELFVPASLSLLLLLLAGPAVQAYSGYYYVIPGSISLRECPRPDCAPLRTVYQGDKVEILERNSTGWSRVRLVDRAAIGWIPNNLISYSPDLRPSPEPPYHVNISSVDLKDKPAPNAATLTTLSFNDPVEMLGVSHSGWAQVRDLRTSLVGWVDPRYLSHSPMGYRRSSPRHRAPVHKAVPQQEKKSPEAPALPGAM